MKIPDEETVVQGAGEDDAAEESRREEGEERIGGFGSGVAADEDGCKEDMQGEEEDRKCSGIEYVGGEEFPVQRLYQVST